MRVAGTPRQLWRQTVNEGKDLAELEFGRLEAGQPVMGAPGGRLRGHIMENSPEVAQRRKCPAHVGWKLSCN